MAWLIPSEKKIKELKKKGKAPSKNIRIGDFQYDANGDIAKYDNGRQKTTSINTGTKVLKEAKKQLATYEASKIEQNKSGIIEKPFVYAYAEILNNNTEISPSTVVRYNNLLNNFIDNPDAPVTGYCDRDILCSEITPELIAEFRQWCAEPVAVTNRSGEIVTTKRFADKTTSMIITRIKSVLAYAKESDYISKNFDLTKIKNIPKSKAKTKDVRGFTEEELKLIFNDKELHPNVWFLFYGLLSLGCRIGQKKPNETVDDEHEARAIRWRDVDIDWNCVDEYFDEDSGKVGTVRIYGRKTNKYRYVPISRSFLKYLYQEYKKRGKNNRDGYLFIMEKGGAVDYNSVYNNLIRVCKRHDIKGVSTHSFRHTFIQRCLIAGINFRTVMNWSGHSDIKTFMIYLESIDAQNDSINKVQNGFFH